MRRSTSTSSLGAPAERPTSHAANNWHIYSGVNSTQQTSHKQSREIAGEASKWQETHDKMWIECFSRRNECTSPQHVATRKLCREDQVIQDLRQALQAHRPQGCGCNCVDIHNNRVNSLHTDLYTTQYSPPRHTHTYIDSQTVTPKFVKLGMKQLAEDSAFETILQNAHLSELFTCAYPHHVSELIHNAAIIRHVKALLIAMATERGTYNPLASTHDDILANRTVGGVNLGSITAYMNDRALTKSQQIIKIPENIRVDKDGGRLVILDIGCGSGMLCGLLAHLFPTASVVGIDSCADKIKAASSVYDSKHGRGYPKYLQKDLLEFQTDSDIDGWLIKTLECLGVSRSLPEDYCTNNGSELGTTQANGDARVLSGDVYIVMLGSNLCGGLAQQTIKIYHRLRAILQHKQDNGMYNKVSSGLFMQPCCAVKRTPTAHITTQPQLAADEQQSNQSDRGTSEVRVKGISIVQPPISLADRHTAHYAYCTQLLCVLKQEIVIETEPDTLTREHTEREGVLCESVPENILSASRGHKGVTRNQSHTSTSVALKANKQSVSAEMAAQLSADLSLGAQPYVYYLVATS